MQREDNISGSIKAMKHAHNIIGGEFSGGQIHAFREGWAIVISSFGKAHYWKRSPFNLAYVESGCGQTAATKLMYGAGNIPRCKNCERVLDRQEKTK